MDKLPRREILPTPEKKNTCEFEFDVAVTQLAGELEERLLRGEKAVGFVYGYPNMGKSTFIRALMAELRKRPGLEYIQGGELKGFDEYTPARKNDQVILVQMPTSRTYLVEPAVVVRSRDLELAQYNLPTDYFSVVMIAPQIYPEYTADQYRGKVDYIVNNPLAVKK